MCLCVHRSLIVGLYNSVPPKKGNKYGIYCNVHLLDILFAQYGTLAAIRSGELDRVLLTGRVLLPDVALLPDRTSRPVGLLAMAMSSLLLV